MTTSGEPEFVFAHRRAELRQEMAEFWASHQPRYREEMRSFRTNADPAAGAAQQAGAQNPLRRQVAAISRDHQGAITGVVWVALRELEADWNLGTHAYFQRMYVVPSVRCLRSSLQLYRLFLRGFQASAAMRDHRATMLLAENVNPGLQVAALRRLFARHGFQLLGRNRLGGEVWCLPLNTTFVF
jgi:hypothetical protein